MSKDLLKLFIATVLVLLPIASQALPIDWHGAFGVDTTLISDYRRISSNTDHSAGANGSQEVAMVGGKADASWQSYIFRLSPTMVVNDAATVFGELTSGYANGGFLGDSPETDKKSGTSGSTPLFIHNQARGQSITLKKAYIELYSDTATYVIGRHSYNWALGAIYNDGKDSWDRHATSRDGITMKLKIGNFHVAPFWSKVSNPGYTDYSNAKELGIALLYDNPERDIAFGLLYNKKSSSSGDTFYQSTIDTVTSYAGALGESNVKITDLYFKKIFGKFDIAAEVPLISGELGKTTTPGNVTSYSAKAFVIQTNYKQTDSWTLGFDGGQVSGHDGSVSKFSALYLNPNYQVANLLFRYNLAAFGDSTQSAYDSYITNARYFKFRSTYNSEKWTFDTAIIHANASETAKAGSTAYNHTKNKLFTAVTSQSDNLGTEIDFNSKYRWNKEISVGFGLGYLFTGQYFGYTNSTSVVNSPKNTLLLQLNTSVTF
jgi:hypothetical protein